MATYVRTPFHLVNPVDPQKTPTAIELLCVVWVRDALHKFQESNGVSYYDTLVDIQGSEETEKEILAMAIHLEEVHDQLQEEYNDEFNDHMMDIWGCYDHDWIPEMARMLYKSSKAGIIDFCIDKVEAKLAATV
jgi:hypothetical protein